MKLLLPLAIAAPFALAACGSAGEGGTTVDAAGNEIEMQPGKWANTMTVEKFDIPGAPPEAAAMFQAAIGEGTTTESCMTQDQLDEGMERRATESMDGQACDTVDFAANDGKINGRIECKADNGGAAVMTVAGTQSAEAMEMTITSDVTDEGIPGGKAQMVMKISGKRLGDC
ncbi:MAG: DUF3617 domain-containing protein [Parerythrobacter sp.]